MAWVGASSEEKKYQWAGNRRLALSERKRPRPSGVGPNIFAQGTADQEKTWNLLDSVARGLFTQANIKCFEGLVVAATNAEIAELLRRYAATLVLEGVDRFKVKAYRKAADTLESLETDVARLVSH